MPVYLMTYHAYCSWMPDHPSGYTRRVEGVMPPDEEMAENYRRAAKGEEVAFDARIQRALIEEAQQAMQFQRLHLYAASTESSHFHLLIGWKDDREPLRIRASLKTSLSRLLTKENAHEGSPKLSLSRGGSHRRVRDETHFEELVKRYLLDDSGVKWFEKGGWVDDA
jgi:REP element-mobilizing transposase RayT